MTDIGKSGICMGRRDFIKQTGIILAGSTLASNAAQANQAGEFSTTAPDSQPIKNNIKLLCLSEFPEQHKKLIASIKSNLEIGLHLKLTKVSYSNPPKLMDSIKDEGADLILLCAGRFATLNYGRLSQYMRDLDIPIVVYSPNEDHIMIDANFVAELRVEGANVKLAVSEMEAIDLLNKSLSSRFAQGKRALVFARQSDSTSVPAHNLTEEYVYRQTGLGIQYRPIDDLISLLKDIDDKSAKEEMNRWKKEAVAIDSIPDRILIDQCRMYILLRSIIEKEGLSAISIDCLSFTFDFNPILPLPCLAFARLRDEGITASCEADVCGMLSSMALENVSGKASFFANVTSVDKKKSSVVLRHCVAPLKLLGPNSPQLQYSLHNYHEFGTAFVPKVDIPVGIDVTLGSYTKDLKNFVVWAGKTCEGIDDIYENLFPGSNIRRYCSNRAEVLIKDADSFFHNIACLHYVMIAGNYTKEIANMMSVENVNIIGPIDSNPS